LNRLAAFALLLAALPALTACPDEEDDPPAAVADAAIAPPDVVAPPDATIEARDASPPDASPPDATPPDATPPDATPAPVLVPVDQVTHGKTYADWAVAWWQFVFAIPRNVNPTRDGDCTIGQSGDVWFLAGNFGGTSTRACHVPAGKAIFFPVLNKICRSCPEGGCQFAHNDDLAECASRGIETTTGLTLEIDGVAFTDVAAQRVLSPAFTWTAPADPADHLLGCLGPVAPNMCGVPEGARLGQTDGFWAMIEPLPPGVHTLHFAGSQTQTSGALFVLDVSYTLTIGD
jgi:hypothetical protein